MLILVQNFCSGTVNHAPVLTALQLNRSFRTVFRLEVDFDLIAVP